MYHRAEDRMRSENETGRQDVFRAMIGANTHESSFSYTLKDMWVESILFLAAGADTTAVTISAALFYLVHNPESQKRLADELRSIFDDENDIRSGGNLKSCLYLHACIQETMRLVPAVATLSPRRVQAGGMMIGNDYIPSGTIVGASIYTLLRNAQVYPKPDEFWPERWLPNESGVMPELQRARRAFCPFGTGPRRCIGWKLAELETTVTVARTVYRYELRPAREWKGQGNKGDYPFRAYAVAAGEGPWVHFTARPGHDATSAVHD